MRPSRSAASAEVRGHVAAVGRGGEVLPPGRRPADRPAEVPREPRHQQVLGIEGDLGAEAPAHARGDDVDPRGLEPKVLRDVVAQPVGGLGGAPHGHRPAGRVVGRRHRPGLHGHRQEPLVAEPRLDDDRRLAEDPRDVPLLPGPSDAQVGGEVGVDQGGVRRERRLRVGHRRERSVVHEDQVGGVLRVVGRVGHDDRDRLPHVARAAGRERQPPRPVDLVEGLGADDHRDLAELGVDVGAGEDARDAGRPARGGDVDPPDLGVGVGAPDEGRVERPGEGEIRHVALARGEEPRVFLALERLADDGAHWATPERPADGLRPVAVGGTPRESIGRFLSDGLDGTALACGGLRRPVASWPPEDSTAPRAARAATRRGRRCRRAPAGTPAPAAPRS